MKEPAAESRVLAGLMIDRAGIVPEAAVQTAGAARNIALATFIIGPVAIAVALVIILTYPVNRQFMMKVKADLAARLAERA